VLRKKKIVYQSDFSLAKTGFGRASKALLTYLHNTGKYDITHYCCGLQYSNPELKRTPWKSIGTLPDTPQEIQDLNRDPNVARMASYGAHFLDKVIKQEKPDVYIAAQDIWGIDFAIDKKWFNKITSVLWTTLDSLPILPTAVEKASKIKNYWIWSDFATKALHDLNHKHVKTMHGPLDCSVFKKLSKDKKINLRQMQNIPYNAFIIGFVFRNQLRKSVPNLLEGYAMWKRRNPQVKNTYLLLHTHWSEGWNIYKLADEYGIDKREILTTYVCKNCGNYEIKPFHGQDVDCRFCRSQKSQLTTNVGIGVSEEQLNEVYNLMDVYCHPFTSGGQEIPIQEAKLTELITLVTNYSCGEELCQEGSGSLELEWTEYREHGTEFRKASTKPASIAKQLDKVYNMNTQKREELGKISREWTLENYSIETVGKAIEEFIDAAPLAEFDFNLEEEKRDPNLVIPNIENDSEWLIFLYKNILKIENIDEKDQGHQYWMNEIKKGVKRQDIENYFRHVAMKENEQIKKIEFEDLLDKNDSGKRIIYVIPESEEDVFLSTSLFKSIKESYPDHNLYVATKPEYFEILNGNPYIHKVLQYIPQMDNILWLEGQGDHKGFFEIAFLPYIGSQRILDYLHNGKTNIQYSIK
jgi:glycosyltransferase involved in cell wall biosynthesis